MRRVRDVRRDCQGASAVEFALVLPILLIVLFGIFELSWLVSSQTLLNYATFQAARTASKAVYAGQTEAEAAQTAKNQAVDAFWMGALETDDIGVAFDDSDDVPQVTVITTVPYESLTGWFGAGVFPTELKSKAVTPY